MFVMAIKAVHSTYSGLISGQLREGDVLIAVGPEESADYFIALADGAKRVLRSPSYTADERSYVHRMSVPRRFASIFREGILWIRM